MIKLFKILSLLPAISFFITSVYASENCFIAKENGKVAKQIGKCENRYSPFSTFKIPIALMGYDSGILTSPQTPLVEFSSEIEKDFAPYYNPKKHPIHLFAARSHIPESWIKYSAVWYSQYITKKLGMDKFREYVNKFDYGNKNVFGDPQKKDGLLNSWLGSSLKISLLEQVDFIEKLINKKLPVSQKAHENTINILRMETIFYDWQLYGKTGGSLKAGWFVGWIAKNDRVIAFAQYIQQSEDALVSGGRVAKEVAKDNLISLIINNAS